MTERQLATGTGTPTLIIPDERLAAVAGRTPGAICSQDLLALTGTGELSVSAVFCGAGSEGESHVHPSDEILHVLDGTTVVKVAGEPDRSVPAGAIATIPAGLRHAHSVSGDRLTTYVSARAEPGLQRTAGSRTTARCQDPIVPKRELGIVASLDEFTGHARRHDVGVASGAVDLRAVAVFFDADARTRPHAHSYDQVLQFVGGPGIVAVDGGADEVVPQGSLYFLPRGQIHMHGATADAPTCHLALFVDGDTDWDVPVPMPWGQLARRGQAAP